MRQKLYVLAAGLMIGGGIGLVGALLGLALQRLLNPKS